MPAGLTTKLWGISLMVVGVGIAVYGVKCIL